jgi:hypothetical protein
MNYQALTSEQQTAIRLQRLAKLEADHFLQSVALAELTAAIVDLKKGLAAPVLTPQSPLESNGEPAPTTTRRR